MNRCRLEGNSFGLISNASTASSKVTVRDSVASGNTATRFRADGGGEMTAEGCLVANNGTGLDSWLGGSLLRASDCTITDNGEGLYTTSGGGLISRSNNTFEGNSLAGSFTGTYTAK